MESIPAFHSEDYMTSSKNFRSIIFFELGRYSIPMGPTKDFSLTWENVREKLVAEESFGGQVKRKGALKDFIEPVLREASNDIAKASRLYAYFQKQIKWNNKHSIYAKNIKEALEKRTGNSADINLGLVGALRYAQLEAIPVILSTRDNGYAGLYAPAISEFNHVVARVKLGEEYYLLDATSPYEPFGNIPLKCVNYQGRSIPLTEKFEIEIENFANLQNDQLAFNPYLDSKTTKNPFNLTERNYPIDFGSLIQEESYMEIKLPKGYTYAPETKLKNISMSLPERAARYIFKVSNSDPNVLLIESATQFNKPLFLPEEYFDLKEFFSRIIQAQKLDISLKKI